MEGCQIHLTREKITAYPHSQIIHQKESQEFEYYFVSCNSNDQKFFLWTNWNALGDDLPMDYPLISYGQ